MSVNVRKSTAIDTETHAVTRQRPELDSNVLVAAREMPDHLNASDATFAVQQAHLTNEHLVDLITIIAFYNGVVRFLATMDVDVEPGSSYEDELRKHHLPD